MTDTTRREEAPDRATWTDWVTGRRVLVAVTVVLVVLPAMRMVRLVGRSSQTQYNDYWPILDGLLQGDGSWRWRGFFEFRNEHPIFVPKVAYWLNVETFGGANHTLGAFVIVLVLAQVALLAAMAKRSGMGRWAGAGLVVTASSLLFARHGAWNFVKAMSGTAWLTANVLVVAALVVQQRDRRLLAPALGLLATFSYGTGLAVWPALALAAVVRDRRGAIRQWPTFACGTATLVWYALWYRSRPPVAALPIPRPSLITVAERTLEGIGSVVAGGSAATPLGAAVTITIVAAGGWALRTRPRVAAPWLGLAGFGVASSALIALGRYRPTALDFSASRYSSLSALTWLAAVALVLLVLPRRWWAALVPLPLVLTITLGGSQSVSELEPSTTKHDLLAIAMRVGVADGNSVQGGFRPLPTITDRLEKIDHYPFNDEFSSTCGALGSTVGVDEQLPDGTSARVTQERDKPRAPGVASLLGTVDPGDRDVDCVVVLDGEDRVVGAAALWAGSAAGSVAFETLSPEGPGQHVAVRFSGSEGFFAVDGG